MRQSSRYKSKIFRRLGFLIHIFSDDWAFYAQIFTIQEIGFPRSLESVDREDLLSLILSEDFVLSACIFSTFLAHIFRRYKIVSRIYSGPKTFLVIYIQEIGLSQSQIFRRFKMVNLIYSGVQTFLVIHIQELGSTSFTTYIQKKGFAQSPTLFIQKIELPQAQTFGKQDFLSHRYSRCKALLAVDVQIQEFLFHDIQEIGPTLPQIFRRQGFLSRRYSGDRPFLVIYIQGILFSQSQLIRGQDFINYIFKRQDFFSHSGNKVFIIVIRNLASLINQAMTGFSQPQIQIFCRARTYSTINIREIQKFLDHDIIQEKGLSSLCLKQGWMVHLRLY